VPRVSVIMPCYNQGQYIDEAVDSVLAQTFQDFEIIIVNDGSTDGDSNRKLASFDKPQCRVLQTTNQGLAAARNAGVREASGEYILPLDADDKIGSTYLEKAVSVLDGDPNVGIVYCEAELFGEESGKWHLEPYCFPEMLLHNFIFCSGFFRKSDWEKTSGYQPMFGWEDYDFWLSLIGMGWEVIRIPEVLFYYRRTSGSMIKTMTREEQLVARTRIFNNHPDLYRQNIHFIFSELARLNAAIEEMTSERLKQAETIAEMRRSMVWRLRERFIRLKYQLLGKS
jgi:glycosyltransferase involved in cell wall biosynthesis